MSRLRLEQEVANTLQNNNPDNTLTSCYARFPCCTHLFRTNLLINSNFTRKGNESKS